MGDAAHAIVPFYGQGMNASFEDVTVLDQVLDEGHEDWETIFKTYEKNRKRDTDAIADLAIDNFHEMKGHVNNAIFREKRHILGGGAVKGGGEHIGAGRRLIRVIRSKTALDEMGALDKAGNGSANQNGGHQRFSAVISIENETKHRKDD